VFRDAVWSEVATLTAPNQRKVNAVSLLRIPECVQKPQANQRASELTGSGLLSRRQADGCYGEASLRD